jgi:diketogulonate reductase-like aldo/keto reductase
MRAYRALETLLADGQVRAIGVSNFMVEHLEKLLDRATVVPAVNRPVACLERGRSGSGADRPGASR